MWIVSVCHSFALMFGGLNVVYLGLCVRGCVGL